MRRKRSWVLGSFIFVSRWLHRTLRIRIGVFIEKFWLTLLTLIAGSGVENMLVGVKTLKGISMFNGG